MLLPLQAILQPTSTQTPPVCAFHGIYLCLFCCVRGLLLLISLPFGFPHGNAHRVNNYGWYNSPTLIKEIWTKKSALDCTNDRIISCMRQRGR